MFSPQLCIDHLCHVACVILRLLVECRFLPGTVLTVGYMVKTPTLGPGVQTQGTLGVQLRIAKGNELHVNANSCFCCKLKPVKMDENFGLNNMSDFSIISVV